MTDDDATGSATPSADTGPGGEDYSLLDALRASAGLAPRTAEPPATPPAGEPAPGGEADDGGEGGWWARYEADAREVECDVCRDDGTVIEFQDGQPGCEWCPHCGGCKRWREGPEQFFVRHLVAAARSLATAEQTRDEAVKLLWRCRTALESAHDGRLGADLREVVLKDLNAALLAGVAR